MLEIMPPDQTDGQIESSFNTMRNNQCWILSFVVIGIITFPQIIAEFNDANQHLINKTLTGADNSECFESFYNTMMNITDESENGTTAETDETINKLTQEFISCMIAAQDANSDVEQDPNIFEDEKISRRQYPDSGPPKEKIKSNTFKPRKKDTNLRIAISMITDAENWGGPTQVLDDLLVRQRHFISEFVNAGWHQSYKQTRYARLVFNMLLTVYHNALHPSLREEIKDLMNDWFNPYISEKIKLPRSMSSKGFHGSNMMRLRNGQPSSAPECYSDTASMFKCVYNYIISLVKLEGQQNFFGREDKMTVYKPFGTKLVYDATDLLIMILEEIDSLRTVSKWDVEYVEMILSAKGKIVICANIIRDKNEAGVFGKTEKKINVIKDCLKRATDIAKGVVDFLISHTYLGDKDTLDIISLEENKIREFLIELMSNFPVIGPLGYLISQKYVDDLLNTKDNPERSFAWDIVRKWNDSSIEDVKRRFATMFGNGHLKNYKCALNDLEVITPFSVLIDECLDSYLKDLVIIESVLLCQHGLTLQVALYGHPIIMNYIYKVDTLLRHYIRPCPGKKSWETKMEEFDRIKRSNRREFFDKIRVNDSF